MEGGSNQRSAQMTDFHPSASEVHMRTRLVIQLAAVVSFVTAPALRAQSTNPFSVDVATGTTLSQGSGVLFHGLAGVGVKLPSSSLGLRFGGMYTGGSPSTSVGTDRVISLTANLVLPFASDHAVSPYLIGGPGLYATPGYGIRAGWNAGGGIDFRVNHTQLFAETRLHVHNGGLLGNGKWQPSRMIPVSIGVRF